LNASCPFNGDLPGTTAVRRRLVKRRWTYDGRSPGRPALGADLVALVCASRARTRAGATAASSGWYSEGVVSVCAWPAHSGFWFESDAEWNDENRELLSLLDVEIDHQQGRVGLLWTEAQARAFTLLDVLPHELGHHRDMMTTHSRRVSRGEPFADAYAHEVLEQVWPAYSRHFDI
jgi:hypothetical protein